MLSSHCHHFDSERASTAEGTL